MKVIQLEAMTKEALLSTYHDGYLGTHYCLDISKLLESFFNASTCGV